MLRAPRALAGLLLAALLALFLAPPAAGAQGALDWREQPGANFTILYASGSEAEVRRYLGFVDAIYDELAVAFNFRTATPLTLRLFPTSEDYYLVNPAARSVPGVVAHADFRRRELVVIIERTRQQTDEEVRNNVRHELAHIVAADLSGNRLNTGFQEGVAQYFEKPAGELDRKIITLRAIRESGRLLPWSAYDDRAQFYSDPAFSYPQALSVVAFLVERYGFGKLREFLTITARSSGYRSALERTYGESPSALEAAWQAWLPSYLDGGYRRSALEVYDLSGLRDLVAQGNYPQAEAELQQALEWLQRNADTQPPEVLAEAQALLERASAGLRADGIAESARAALLEGDYPRAQELVAAAQAAYARLGDARQDAVLAAYAQRAARGLRASDMLIAANDLARGLRLPQARASADAAAGEFAALGDQLRLDNARALRRSLDERQRLLGLLLIVVGGAGAALSLLGRFFQRPAEVW